MQFFRLQKLNRNKSTYEVHVLLLYTKMFACAFRFCSASASAVAAAAAVLLLLLLLVSAAAASAAAAAAAAVTIALLLDLLGVFFFFQLSCENAVQNSQTSFG